MVNSPEQDLIDAEYQMGQTAFEKGEYRRSVQHLEKAAALSSRNSRIGGEAQLWLVTAYEANGQREEALTLARQLTRFPDPEIRKQSRRLLYIMEAPQLMKRSEWLTQIPDLTDLEDSDSALYSTADRKPKRRPAARTRPEPEPEDLSQMNTGDNRFIWLALGTIGLLLLGLMGFN
ncbi:hypothetical protein BST81_18940 [Leptolyngbya sp. 'hensonii']|uniref:tetratricopeptide repeat protein n=1 Tax=Leptolyngbya sp. 'hensonii' TaxID=1922337 RepID=UPI000950181D|nr:tetratricopeptide repeat protein [Leptolyngbya sp. 'hensonii']OLP16774.1 hypothetical protein BST81_18940 [Leptolyngbya sp. 'hensonii']